MFQDVRFALRLFRRHHVPVAIAIGGLALAIGVVASVFTVVDGAMLRPYGMDDPSSVVTVTRPTHNSAFPYWPYAQFRMMRDNATLCTVEASSLENVRLATTANADHDTSRRILFVSGAYLHTLGGRPALGRTLDPSDDQAGAPAVVVVSHHFWTTELRADPSAIGTTLWLNGAPATLVGVLQPEFTGPVQAEIRPSMWAPLADYDDLHLGPPFDEASRALVEVIARLAPGATSQSAQDNLAAIVGRSNTSSASSGSDRPALRLYGAGSPMDGANAMESYLAVALFFGIVGLVLAAACANTANLLLAAAVTRMQEIGVRLSLGASRGRLIKQMFSESLLLALIAGGLGLLFAFWFGPVLAAMLNLPELIAVPDSRVTVFTIAVAVVCALGAGLSPARHGSRGDVVSALKSQQASDRALRPSRLRTSFVGFQAAVSMLLLVAAALLARSALQLTRIHTGYDADRLLSVSLSLPRKDFDEPAYVRRALAAVRELPFVDIASITQYQPYGGSIETNRFSSSGREIPRRDTTLVAYTLYVNRSDENFLSTAGIRLLRGRAFTPEEVVHEAPVALISDSAARKFFKDADPLGQSLASWQPGTTTYVNAAVVGVVTDALMTRLYSQDFGTIYRPISQVRDNPPALLVRTANPASAAHAIEDALRQIDARAQIAASVLRENIDVELGHKRMLAWLAGPTAILALMLAVLGVFGVTAFVASQRSHEMSVRVAIGASAADVMRLLVTDGLRPVIVGLVLGLGASLALGRVSASLLAGISPHDPLAIGAATVTMLAAALAAVILPARRAASTDPVALLRQI